MWMHGATYFASTLIAVLTQVNRRVAATCHTGFNKDMDALYLQYECVILFVLVRTGKLMGTLSTSFCCITLCCMHCTNTFYRYLPSVKQTNNLQIACNMYVNLRIVLPSKFTRVITITIRIWKVLCSNLACETDYLEVLHPLPLFETNSIRVSLPCLLSLTGCVCMVYIFKCLYNLYLFTFIIYLFKSCVCDILNFNSDLKFSFLVSFLLITETAALQLWVLLGEGQPCGQRLNRTELLRFTAACSQLIRPPPHSCSET